MTTITHSIARALWAALLIVTPQLAGAITLDLPNGARQTTGSQTEGDSYLLPVAPWNGETVPAREIEGVVTRQAWRLGVSGLTTLQVLRPLRTQLKDAGYEVLFECRDTACGGFDFRFSTEVIPAPDMLVDLTQFRFLAAIKDAEAVTLLISRNRQASFVQLIHVGPDGGAVTVTKSASVVHRGPQGPMGETLETVGHVVLDDLTFETGSSNLGQGTFTSLADLAAYLKANPSRKVALVGHTDSVGALDGNIALSKRRAGSVRDRLISAHNVAKSQMSAEGMGFLSPIAANLTAAGREANRRVEAVLISTK